MNHYTTAGIIRIYHECDNGIECSVPMITIRQHEAYQVMTKGDSEGGVILSHPHTHDGFL